MILDKQRSHIVDNARSSPNKSIKSIKSGVPKTGEATSVDDYEDDEFDSQDQSGSISGPQKVTNITNEIHKTQKSETLEFNLSTSLLPPVHGGGRRETIDSQQYLSGGSVATKKPLPENFALKLEESEQSLNFEFSDSKNFAIAGHRRNQMGSNVNLGSRDSINFKESVVEGSDFDLSESNFSLSKSKGAMLSFEKSGSQKGIIPGHMGTRQRSSTENKKEKKFYAFKESKFSSHTGDNRPHQ